MKSKLPSVQALKRFVPHSAQMAPLTGQKAEQANHLQTSFQNVLSQGRYTRATSILIAEEFHTARCSSIY